MNEFFIYLEGITASLGYLNGWRIFKMTDVALTGRNAKNPQTETLRKHMTTLRKHNG